MTSKEFQRRKFIYSQLDECANFFLHNPNLDYVYRATLCVSVSKEILTGYCSSPCLGRFPESKLCFCDYVSFDKFTYQEFLVQYRYFLSFLNRLSDNQLKVLKSSRCCKNLFSFALKYEDSKQ